MLTCPCNVDRLTPHFYIAKLELTRVYIFLIFALKQIVGTRYNCLIDDNSLDVEITVNIRLLGNNFTISDRCLDILFLITLISH